MVIVARMSVLGSLSVFLAITSAAPRVVTLDEALRSALKNLPQLVSAHAALLAQVATADAALAPMLPQINGTASVGARTANFVSSPGSLPMGVANGGVSGVQINSTPVGSYSTGITISQFLYDFGETFHKWKSQQVGAEAQEDSERNTIEQMKLALRTTYFNARATKALLGVANETLSNQKKHLDQAVAFVKAGRDPEINLATARTNYANAKVALVTADNNYLISKAQLNQAMGVEQSTDYEVADDDLGPVDGEDADVESLNAEARKARPDIVSLQKQVTSQEIMVQATKEQYAPAISTSSNLTYAGADITQLVPNWGASVTLSVPIFNGKLTPAQVRQQEAQLDIIRAQLDQQRQQVRFDVEQARLAIRAAKANIVGAAEALTNAKEQLRLAQGRYEQGVGNIIELGDAQVAQTAANAQVVQAEYNLATARAQLLKALGRR